MVDIQVNCGPDPRDLAELIASTLHGLVPPEPDSVTADVGRAIRAAQEQTERTRRQWADMDTIDFSRLERDEDWTDV